MNSVFAITRLLELGRPEVGNLLASLVIALLSTSWLFWVWAVRDETGKHMVVYLLIASLALVSWASVLTAAIPVFAITDMAWPMRFASASLRTMAAIFLLTHMVWGWRLVVRLRRNRKKG